MSEGSPTSTVVAIEPTAVLKADEASVSSSLESSKILSSDSDSSIICGNGGKLREMTPLPKSFEPRSTDVLIGRGRKARDHEGNKRLKMLIELMIPEYSAAGGNKDEKSYIIKEIVTQIRKCSPDGGFVKFDKSKGRWYEVGDFLAREKVSQTFRDAMGDTYSSSNPFKRKRRSFEKQHIAIADAIKRRRGSSPTSVVSPGVSSTPPSPTSPQTQASPMVKLSQMQHLHQTPSAISQSHHSMMMQMNVRPGQIGFARRCSMMQMGAATGNSHLASFARNPTTSLQRPVPQMAVTPGAFSLPRRVSLEMERRTSMSTAYNPALVMNAEMMIRQRMAQKAAMMRRFSGF
jgi:hypothetical protein